MPRTARRGRRGGRDDRPGPADRRQRRPDHGDPGRRHPRPARRRRARPGGNRPAAATAASAETTARFRSTTSRRRRPPRWPTRPGTGPGAPSRAARCPASPTSGPPTPARWSPGSCTASPAAAGCRPTRPPTCCTATGYWLVDASRPAAKTRQSGPPRQCPARWYSRPRCPGSCRTDASAVELDLHTEAEVRAAYRRLADRFGRRLSQVLVQPMVTGGTEVTIGVTDDRVFGPLVVFGRAKPDHAARLTPLTDTDADALIRSIDAAPRLLGQRGGRRHRPGDAAQAAAASLPARRRPARGHRARPQPGHRQAARGVRDGRADQGDTLPAARPLSSQAALTGPGPGAAVPGGVGRGARRPVSLCRAR